MKVYSFTRFAVIIEALLRGVSDGQDILTMSLGGPDGWTEGSSSVVSSRIASTGKIVTIAAGQCAICLLISMTQATLQVTMVPKEHSTRPGPATPLTLSLSLLSIIQLFPCRTRLCMVSHTTQSPISMPCPCLLLPPCRSSPQVTIQQ